MITYDIKKYPFRDVVCEILEVDDLKTIHKIHYDENYKRENYLKGVGGALQETYFHKKFYENKENFLKIYRSFIKDVISKSFEESILYQSTPTFRIQAHDSVSVIGLDHTEQSKQLGIEGLHRDEDYNHSDEEMNFFLPFVDTNSQNTVWAESEPDKGDYSPFLLKYGEVKMWRGAKLMHGNVVNMSGESRVSVDFRVLPISKFKDDKSKTLTKKITFEVGGYWEKVC